uniref:RING-type domain-containing protein n=1 Tax=Meloidogyne incognita TaxID=6306 RepID=A0A914MYJ3_MELIC
MRVNIKKFNKYQLAKFHYFHKKCLQPWLKTKDVKYVYGNYVKKEGCPMCRAEVLCKKEKKEIIPINYKRS